jgi:hypothetical protein
MVRWKGKIRLVWAAFAVACGSLSAFYVQPIIHNNADANNLTVTVFTVFAGVVIALLTVIGDPALMPGHNWRSAEFAYRRADNQLIIQASLFFLYLFVIFLFLACYVLKGLPFHPFTSRLEMRLEAVYCFFSAVSFVISFSLPLTMLRLQRKRLALEVERRRREAGIKPPLGV